VLVSKIAVGTLRAMDEDRNKEKHVKKLLIAAMATLTFAACSNWNRMTPAGTMDNAATSAEVKKNLLGDRLTGLGVDTDNGVVTLTGHLPTREDRRTAVHDAEKVNGVKRVVDQIEVP
jgi:osmotically-inducible protein OsmY